MIDRDCNISRSTQRGVGLIEILVAVFLLSIGFLAAAQMQVQSMRFSQSAYYQSQAYFLASDMIDRMRSNVDAVSDGDYDDMATTALPVDPQCAINACSSGQLALQDLFDWSAKLHALNGETNFQAALPSYGGTAAEGSVTALGDNMFAVTLVWGEEIDGKSLAQRLTINFASEANQ